MRRAAAAWVVVLATAIGPLPAATVRVALDRYASLILAGPALRITPPGGTPQRGAGPMEIRADGERVRTPGGDWPAGTCFEPTDGEPHSLTSHATSGDRGRERRYRGSLRLWPVAGRLLVVNELDVEQYLRGVVPAEIDPEGRPAALQAQAVAARTFALFRQAASRDARYDFDVASTQAYPGASREEPATDDAVIATAGKTLVKDGQRIESVYGDCCGGVQASAAEAWASEEAGLRASWDRAAGGVPQLAGELLHGFLTTHGDGWCRRSPMYRWTRRVAASDVYRRVGEWCADHRPRVKLGRVQAVSVASRWPGGRVRELRIRGTQGETTVQGDGMRWVFGDGEHALPSSLVEWTAEDGALTFRGAGWGHGVGLCQAGALAMAAAGQDRAAILAHYYDGATER